MSLSDQDEGVKKRAVDNIMKLINSQLALEKKKAKMDAKDQEKGNAAKRMAEINETLEKLVAVAKKKGFIDPECTVQSLKEEAAKKKSEDDQGDAVGLMTTMKQKLDEQTLAVQDFLRDRVNHDAEWEEHAWAELLSSHQDNLVLMQRLLEKNLITQDMIAMATLPAEAPPRNLDADSKSISMAVSQLHRSLCQPRISIMFTLLVTSVSWVVGRYWVVRGRPGRPEALH